MRQSNRNISVSMDSLECRRLMAVDLAVQDVRITGRFGPGETIKLTGNTVSLGTDTAYLTTTRFYVISNGKREEVDSDRITRLKSGASASFSESFKLPRGLSNPFSIEVIADADRDYSERNEKNNVYSFTSRGGISPGISGVAFENPIKGMHVTTSWLARGDDNRVDNDDPHDYRPGRVHLGIDYRGAEKTPVIAIADGVVVKVHRSDKAWGKGNVAVLVRHNSTNGEFVALYGHIRSSLAEGTELRAGQEIGKVGPYDDGAHLHFGIFPITSTATLPTPRYVGGTGYEFEYGYGTGPLAHHDLTGETIGFVDPGAWLRKYKAIND